MTHGRMSSKRVCQQLNIFLSQLLVCLRREKLGQGLDNKPGQGRRQWRNQGGSKGSADPSEISGGARSGFLRGPLWLWRGLLLPWMGPLLPWRGRSSFGGARFGFAGARSGLSGARSGLGGPALALEGPLWPWRARSVFEGARSCFVGAAVAF